MKTFLFCFFFLCCVSLFAQDDYAPSNVGQREEKPVLPILKNVFYYEHWGVLEKFSVNYERVLYDFSKNAHLAVRVGGSFYERLEYDCNSGWCWNAPQFKRKYDVTAFMGAINILLGSRKHFFEPSLLFRNGTFSHFEAAATNGNSSEDVKYNIVGCSFAYRFQSTRPGVVLRGGINTTMYHFSKSPFGIFISGGVVF